jgi:hypothetical protein
MYTFLRYFYTLPSGAQLMLPGSGIQLHGDVIMDPIRIIGGER